MNTLDLVKFGGSLITEKDRPFTVRDEVIVRLAREVAAGRTALDGALVVGHGSGSYGHVAADRSERENDPPPVALSRTQRAVMALHRRVVEALREEDVPAFSFVPSSAFVASDGSPVDGSAEPLRRALGLGAVPVTFGDVCLDRTRGTTICSTETILQTLTEALKAEGIAVRRVLWLGDTDGVYDATGETIETLPPSRIPPLLEQVGSPSGTDVTGGMRHRLRAARALAHRGVPSLITSGLDAGRLRRALRGETVRGTQIPAEASATGE